ncbi:NAD(P)-dependent oxidoreductase [Candidatus Venteria ishoeyi]|uniref:NAD-dependent epimerase/dehydratase family protein n=1 Tax=Candidatus Venteria ishoeyi TaxID=1899563 RepID=UPI0025A68899|nr:NAD(P)-dependent oxidoreductase [Candidatus Venteria ishoeyi]MDM8547726.1 NAD(P)-dependent oxidoreductase [Candidatus Venteria ishoeyi]
MLNGQTFLITGATGRLGRDLSARLEMLGAQVLPLVLPGYPEQPRRVDWIADSQPIVVQSAEDLTGLAKPDRVIHLHWQVQRDKTFTEQMRYELDSNIHQLSFLWDWLKTHPPVSFSNISSIRVFSRLNQNPIQAMDPPHPDTPYGLLKQTAENFFEQHFADCKTVVSHLRLGSVASPGEHPSQLLSRLYRSAFENEAIIVNSGHVTGLLWIDEAVDLLISAAMHAQAQAYLLTPAAIDNAEIARCFMAVSGRTLNARYQNLAPDCPDPVFVSDIPQFQHDWVRQFSLQTMIQQRIKKESNT